MENGDVMTVEQRIARLEYVLGTFIAWSTDQSGGGKLLEMLHDNDPAHIPEFFRAPANRRHAHEIRPAPRPDRG